jgi:shikimate kinase
MNLNLKRSVVLVGMMGCGKSAVGYRLAMDLEIPFIDLDCEIEKSQKMTITQIFENQGEACFRRIEQETINDILNSRICILATGGGAFINDSVRKLIKKLGISVYIRADFDILIERVSRRNNRPLLENGDKAQLLKALMDKRCHIYEEADIIVDSTNGEHQLVVEKIIEGLSDYS